MPALTDIPPELRTGPFTLERARSLGLTRDMLRGKRFRRILKGVYILTEIPHSEVWLLARHF
ncbi:MAG: hypothetical protein H0X18_01680 [Geodermatophilaceae bacterium]|nr:hypothetical protein [Geodermatophilaceae bacterium]